MARIGESAVAVDLQPQFGLVDLGGFARCEALARQADSLAVNDREAMT